MYRIIAEHKKTGLKAEMFFKSIGEARERNPEFKNFQYLGIYKPRKNKAR